MYWNDHKEFEGLHAFLGASQYHWMKWTDDILKQRYINSFSTDIGTIIHELASKCIKRKVKLTDEDTNLIYMTLKDNHIPDNVCNIKKILDNVKNFINDSIDNNMSSEVILFYSDLAFGTTDAINFNGKKLLIFDLKTGVIQARFEQLLIYSALFCLEYDIIPTTISFELRIYQSGDVIQFEPKGEEIQWYMDTIVTTEQKLRDIVDMEGIK